MLILLQLFSARGFQDKPTSQIEQGQGCRYTTLFLPNPALLETTALPPPKKKTKKYRKKEKMES